MRDEKPFRLIVNGEVRDVDRPMDLEKASDAPKPDGGVVSCLENLLADAKAGKVTFAGIVVEDGNGGASWFLAGGGGSGFAVVGALEHMKSRVMLEMPEEELVD